MVGWIILAVFVCLIVTILCLRVRLWVCFGEELRVTAAVGLVTMQLVPPPEQNIIVIFAQKTTPVIVQLTESEIYSAPIHKKLLIKAKKSDII